MAGLFARLTVLRNEIRLTWQNENYKTKSKEPKLTRQPTKHMARPKASELTERELDVMHVFWEAAESPLTAADAQQRLAAAGRELAYTTVATLVRILLDKEFLVQTNDQRPFAYKPGRSFEDVSRSIVGNLVDRVFQGSREQLLLRLVETKRLTAKERALLEGILKEKK
jgi:BlaI family penicillinase repressor